MLITYHPCFKNTWCPFVIVPLSLFGGNNIGYVNVGSVTIHVRKETDDVIRSNMSAKLALSGLLCPMARFVKKL